MKTKSEHATIRNQKLFCLNCGGEFALQYPIGISEMTSKIDSFNMLHKDCKKTWTEPKANQSESAKSKAMWWIINGEQGMSSKAMWACLMGQQGDGNHPCDPDDFSRCYKLLEAVPEWKADLGKLTKLSDTWKNLVGNWDKLTQMYEQNVKENWKNHKQIGMYEFMKKLGC